jgi:hypothetical protein
VTAAKVKRVDMGAGLAPAWRHWCPGCKMNHVIYTDPRAQPNGHHWRFNGNVEAPTFEPSVHIVGRCHYFIRDGRIDYCGDSSHALAGQTVDLPTLASVDEDWE